MLFLASSRAVEHKVIDTGRADTLIIVDEMARKLKFPSTSVFVLKTQEGLKEVCELISSEKLDVRKYRFVVLLCGRADLWELFKSFTNNIVDCLRVIRNRNKLAIIVLTAALPVPGDDRRIINNSGMRNHFMSQMAMEALRLEFSKPGKHLIQFGRVDQKFFNERNELSDQGLDLVSFALLAKFKCTKLRNLYLMLQNQQEV